MLCCHFMFKHTHLRINHKLLLQQREAVGLIETLQMLLSLKHFTVGKSPSALLFRKQVISICNLLLVKKCVPDMKISFG